MNEIGPLEISNIPNGMAKIEPLISKYCFGLKTPMPLLEEYRISFQHVVGNKLNVIVFLPGIKKKSLILRVNEETLAISAEYLKEIKEFLKPCRPLELRISLIERVDVKSAKAVYKNGVVFIELEIINNKKNNNQEI